VTSSLISMLSIDLTRVAVVILQRLRASKRTLLFSFLFFRWPVHPRLYITFAPFFLYTSARYTRHRRVSARHVLSKSAPVTERFRWHKDIPTTIKKSLDSVALLLARPETENSSASLFRLIPCNRRRASSRYRVRSRSFVALHVDLAVNSWILSIRVDSIRKIEKTWSKEN